MSFSTSPSGRPRNKRRSIGGKRDRTGRQVREHGRADGEEVASQTSDVAGDGTTTATVLAQSILNEGLKSVAAGMNPMDLKRGIDKAVAGMVEKLRSYPPLQRL